MLRLLWDVPIAIRREMDNYAVDVEELYVKGGAVCSQPAILGEESTTVRFASQLSRRGKRLGVPVTVAVHGKGLEGGGKGRAASGADLQLSLEISPGVWINLLLQAKSLNRKAKYGDWKHDQLDDLRKYVAALNLTTGSPDFAAGVLLYNPRTGPFGPSSAPLSLAFGQCCNTAATFDDRKAFFSPGVKRPPDLHLNSKVPMGVTIAILPPITPSTPVPAPWPPTALKQPSASDLLGFSAPLACLTCPRFTGSAPVVPFVPLVTTTTTRPPWLASATGALTAAAGGGAAGGGAAGGGAAGGGAAGGGAAGGGAAGGGAAGGGAAGAGAAGAGAAGAGAAGAGGGSPSRSADVIQTDLSRNGIHAPVLVAIQQPENQRNPRQQSA